jgi:hypothetical protein
MNPIHKPETYLFKIHLNILLATTLSEVQLKFLCIYHQPMRAVCPVYNCSNDDDDDDHDDDDDDMNNNVLRG